MRRGPPQARERPFVAGGVLLSHGLHRSTIGAGGLSFRVRDGTGRDSPAMAAGHEGALFAFGVRPGGRALRAAQRDRLRSSNQKVAMKEELGRLVPLGSTPRGASTCGLSTS